MVSGGFTNCPCGVSSMLGRTIGLGDGDFEGSGAGGKDSVGEGSGSGREVEDGVSADRSNGKLNNIPYAMEISKIRIADSVKNPRLVTALFQSNMYWSRRRESNSRLAVYETATLPLSYSGLVSGIPESNRRLFLGKEAYCHYTNPAYRIMCLGIS